MKKIAILGIDGLDPLLLDKWKEFLPNISEMFNHLDEIVTESTFPPDSICAWASIFTGENPAQHGLLESINYLSSKKEVGAINRTDAFKGKTFWDVASSNGKKVCIINPFMAYPAWEVNGIMVSGPVFEGGNISAYPDKILEKYEFPPLGGIVDFPDEKFLEDFLIRTEESTQQLADVSLKLFKDHDPDLFFVTFLTLDRVLHFLWRYTDVEDPYYPGENPFKNSIRDFYVLFDNIIGEFKNALDDETELLIISDHGHRRRCIKCLNLNEFLRIRGHLHVEDGGVKGILKKTIEKAKVFTLSTMSKYDLQDWIYKIAKFVPYKKSLKDSSYLVDVDEQNVTLSDICGANPHGGINVNANTIEEYERFRDAIIKDLMEINAEVGEKVVKWVKRREEVYTGENEKALPDVLFELTEDYGVGMDMYVPLISPNHTHKKVSGGHTSEASFLAYQKSSQNNLHNRSSSVIDHKNYILRKMTDLRNNKDRFAVQSIINYKGLLRIHRWIG